MAEMAEIVEVVEREEKVKKMGRGGGGWVYHPRLARSSTFFFFGDFGPNSRVEIIVFGWG